MKKTDSFIKMDKGITAVKKKTKSRTEISASTKNLIKKESKQGRILTKNNSTNKDFYKSSIQQDQSLPKNINLHSTMIQRSISPEKYLLEDTAISDKMLKKMNSRNSTSRFVDGSNNPDSHRQNTHMANFIENSIEENGIDSCIDACNPDTDEIVTGQEELIEIRKNPYGL
jgi:hypothetical protein